MTPRYELTAPPPPGSRRDFMFPRFEVDRLDNGLTLYTLADSTVPLANLEVLSHAGGLANPLDRPGLASLHGDLLDEGTARSSALDLALRAEGFGGSLRSGAGWHLAYADVGLLSSSLDDGLELLAEVMLEASFPGDELERLRAEALAGILRRRSQPAALADDRFAATIFTGTPFGSPQIGTAESLRAITRDEIVAFSRRYVTPRNSTLVAVGDLDPDAVRASVERLFGGWSHEVERREEPIVARRLEQPEVHLVDRPQAAQTQLLVGHDAPPRDQDDYAALKVMNTLLGGKFTSRINLNLREKHGYTYGANSRLTVRRYVSLFTVGAAIATPSVGHSVREILGELERLQAEPPGADEMRDSQEFLLSSFPSTLQTVDELSSRLETLVVFGLPDDFYDTYPALFADVTAEQVRAAAQEHLRPDGVAIVAVGPAAELRPQLEEFGPVTVHQA
ncbi:MAG: pitrilysin family protein [Acidobacteriota bacterium]